MAQALQAVRGMNDVLPAESPLWERFEDQIVNAEVDWRLLNDLSTKKISNDLVFTTIPHWTICHQGHSFDKVPYRIQTLPTAPNEEHTEILLYNGLARDRKSVV